MNATQKNTSEKLFKLSKWKKGIIIDRCPICGRKGIVRLRKKASLRLRLDIEHWILYADQKEMISSVRNRNDRCRIEEGDELFEILFREYSKLRGPESCKVG